MENKAEIHDNIITMVIDRTNVKGEIIHRSSYSITIKILEPYEEFTSGLNITRYARASRSYNGEYGDEACVYILEDLYKSSKFFYKNIDNLRLKLEDTERSIEEKAQNLMTNIKFREKRSELKKRLKSGEIDSKTYQKNLSILKKLNRQCKEIQDGLIDKFFKSNFTFATRYDFRDQAINILKKSKEQDYE